MPVVTVEVFVEDLQGLAETAVTVVYQQAVVLVSIYWLTTVLVEGVVRQLAVLAEVVVEMSDTIVVKNIVSVENMVEVAVFVECLIYLCLVEFDGNQRVLYGNIAVQNDFADEDIALDIEGCQFGYVEVPVQERIDLAV